jgi:tetratricopeptide (TPR) repeat protein
VANNEREEAADLVRRGMQLFPKNAAMYGALAVLELRAGRRGDAIACLQRGLAAMPQEQELLWSLSLLLIDDGNVAEAEKTLALLRATRYPLPPIAFLESRILIEKGEWFDACERLKELRPSLANWPGLVHQADLRLGQCYEQLGRSDLQLEASRRAAGGDPRSIPARMGIARALLSAGQFDEALEEYRQIAALPGAPPAALVQLTQLLISANLRADPLVANWDVASRLLDKIDEVDPDSITVPLLRAEILAAKGDLQKAEDLLRRARDQSPETEDYWLGLVSLAERHEDAARAAELLDQAEATVGDTVPIRLARARHLVNRQGPGAKDALRKLAHTAERFTMYQQLALAAGLAGLTLAIEDFEETERLYRRLAEEQPKNLQVRRMLFELAFRAEEPEMMERELEHVREIEHLGPLWHYGEALHQVVVAKRLSEQAKSMEQPDLGVQAADRYAQAKAHLVEARLIRPRWWRIPALVGQISDMQGDEDLALANYLEAIKFGETNPSIVSRAVALLVARRRYLEADQIIRRLQVLQSQLTTEMAHVATEVSLRLNDGERALSLVSQAAADSKDANEHIWAGRVFSALGRSDDAERRFRKALELDETSSVAWLSLIKHFGRTSQTEKANAALAEAERKIPPAEAPLAVADALDAIGGRFDDAEAKYKSALAVAPREIPVVRRVAEFYLRNSRPKEAEPLLAMIVDAQPVKPDDRVWGRQNLAQALLNRGTLDSLRKALALIEENLTAKPASETDLRIKAVVLSRLPDRESPAKAIDILEKLVSDSQSATGDAAAESRFLLAQLYLGHGDVAKASALLRKLLTTGGDDSRYVSFYVRFLLQQKELTEADVWVGRLAKQAPQEFNTISLMTEVQFAGEKYTNLLADIDGFLSAFKGNDAERQSATARSAILLENYAARIRAARDAAAGNDTAGPQEWETRYLERAAVLYRDYSRERPDYPLALAGFLGRQGRHSESLDILEHDWSASRQEDIVAVTSTLFKSPVATDEHYARAEAVLTSALDKHSRPLLLLLGYADLQNWHGRYDDAERLYREVLDKDSRNASSLNNLSLLLAFRGHLGPEPQSMIDMALQVVGDNPSLLDTRATINLLKGDLSKAASDLARAIERGPTSQKYFHLAQLEMRKGKPDAAREALEKAASLRLKPEDLHPLERSAYRQLQADLR